MNEPASQMETSSGQVEELQDEVQSLKTILCVTLILMMVFGACVDFFLVKQVSELRSLVSSAEQLTKAVDITKSADLWNKLNEYAKTHPDFAPIMANARPYAAQTMLNPAYAPKKK